MNASQTHPLVAEGQIFLAAGVYDPLSAKLAERAGFRNVVLSGYAVAAAHLGEPDFGLLTQSEILEVARRVVRAVDIPVVVDGDTGFGGALNVVRMVEELVAMGARGVILEDQTWPKRCGHMRGKAVVPMEEHVQKIRAAVDARGEAPFLITARTDARAPLGLDEAIRRAHAYHEAGATAIFIEAPESVEEMARIAREAPGLLVANMIDGGKTPILPLRALHELGFHNVGYVLTGIFAAARALSDTYAHLLATGSSEGLGDRLMSFEEFTGLLGLEEKYRLDERYRGGEV
ncbi:MAG: oxaloacetate decarboxylase [Myxococcota bacterium]|nr:oxaloacetate decarboxylase [Myxococcota bacterium]